MEPLLGSARCTLAQVNLAGQRRWAGPAVTSPALQTEGGLGEHREPCPRVGKRAMQHITCLPSRRVLPCASFSCNPDISFLHFASDTQILTHSGPRHLPLGECRSEKPAARRQSPPHHPALLSTPVTGSNQLRTLRCRCHAAGGCAGTGGALREAVRDAQIPRLEDDLKHRCSSLRSSRTNARRGRFQHLTAGVWVKQTAPVSQVLLSRSPAV